MALRCLWKPSISSSWFGFSFRCTQQGPSPSSTHRSVTLTISLKKWSFLQPDGLQWARAATRGQSRVTCERAFYSCHTLFNYAESTVCSWQTSQKCVCVCVWVRVCVRVYVVVYAEHQRALHLPSPSFLAHHTHTLFTVARTFDRLPGDTGLLEGSFLRSCCAWKRVAPSASSSANKCHFISFN